jgi:hypothetical protein
MSSVALSAYSRPLMSHSVDRAAHETRRRMCRADAFEVDQPPAHDAVDFAVRAAPICTAHTLSGHCGSRRRGRTAAGFGSERLPLAGAGDEKISGPLRAGRNCSSTSSLSTANPTSRFIDSSTFAWSN